MLKESVTGSPTSGPLRTLLGQRLLFCADQGQFGPAGVRCFEKTGGRKVHGRKRILIYCQTASGRWLRGQVALQQPGLGSHPHAASAPRAPPARPPPGRCPLFPRVSVTALPTELIPRLLVPFLRCNHFILLGEEVGVLKKRK